MARTKKSKTAGKADTASSQDKTTDDTVTSAEAEVSAAEQGDMTPDSAGDDTVASSVEENAVDSADAAPDSAEADGAASEASDPSADAAPVDGTDTVAAPEDDPDHALAPETSDGDESEPEAEDLSSDAPASSESDDTLAAEAVGAGASPEVTPDEPAPQVIRETVVEKKAGFVPMVLGGAVAAALGFGLASYTGGASFLSGGDTVNPFEEETRAALGESSGRLDGLAEQIGAVETAVAGIDLSGLLYSSWWLRPDSNRGPHHYE